MVQNSCPVSIPEKDYLAILDTITQFHGCDTREALRGVFSSHVLPLFEADSALYGWINMDFTSKSLGQVGLVDCVGVPQEDFNQLSDSIPYIKSIPTMLERVARPVVAVDVDIPREVFVKEKDQFFAENPEYVRDSWLYLNPIANFLATFDQPEITHGLGIHRHAPIEEVDQYDKNFTLRDIRVLELLRPHLLQTIKTIILNDELKRYRSLVDALVDVPTGIALFHSNMRVLFCNRVFSEVVGVSTGQMIPPELMRILSREISRFEPPYEIQSSPVELVFYQLPEGVFRLNLCMLERKNWGQDPCWLLQMKPVEDPYSLRNLAMQEAGLDKVQMEISCLVLDGMEPVAIAARLFISPENVQENIKQIYEKLGVQTREQFFSRMNLPNE
ncbi:helix-turn-helix transcriptional regulator [Nitrospina gracilis]|uniref:helix-turn-helix transcriptional regulator n=1 Tax=Nitrospina gracilis TaxID=35801 RepID=UPI001F2E0966|nr:helix-turn-helix transcriptional regulator [Nitrospina gracilis]MCF8720964.1 DNA-binding CsgD family transcriptional regulator/PAS domain-containing protein [Nitrospina gracilis Nb-211]